MVARGELGFVMVVDARSRGLIDDDIAACCVWALLLCTALAPAAFSLALGKLLRTTALEQQPDGKQNGAVALP